MSSSPGLPLQQVTATTSPNTLPSRALPPSHQQQQIPRPEKRDSTRTASPNRSPRNTVEGDSEAETVVLPGASTTAAIAVIPVETRKKPNTSAIAENGEANEHEVGRRRRTSETGGTGGGRGGGGGGGERAAGIKREGAGGAAEGGRERSGRDGGNGSRGRGVSQMANERKPRGRPPKRRAKIEDEDEDEHDSSDLSSVPSRSSRTGSPSYPIHRRKVKQQRSQPPPSQPEHQEKQREQRERQTQHNGGLRKRKVSGFASGVRADSSGSEAENSDDLRHSRPRRRKRRRSLPPDSPPPQSRLPIKSSPPPSPHSLSPFKSSARIRVRNHAGQRVKYRKIPAPLNSLSREKHSGDEASSSSSSSRDGSPAHTSRHPHRPQSSVRTPGSPVSMSHKPKRDTAGRTHLHRACQRGAVAEVETILSQGKEFLNEEDNAGYMPLHEACLHGHLDVVKVLLNSGAWLDVPSRLELDTPLLDAVDNGHADVVKYLLELGADPRKRNKQGQTALDANDANREAPGVFQEIEDLLKVAINKLRTKRSSDDENPRASAAADSHSSRDPSVASPVHQSPQAPSVQTATRRRNARTEQSRKDLLWLDAGKNGLQKLRETAREGDQQMVHALLERGTKPDTESLIGAIKGGHTDTVSLLLAYNAIVDPEPGNPGRDGSRKSRDTSIPAGEETPMLAAIGRGNPEVLRYLLENGVDPRRRDSRGKSYVEIAREREGEFWEEEVDMLKKAWDKAGGGRESRADKARNPSSTHKGSSPKPKKTTDGKTAPSSSRRPNHTSASSLNPNMPLRRSSSVNPSKYDNTTAVSDHESTAEPLGPPQPRRRSKRSESDSIPPATAKKKRRLISARALAEERSQDIPKSTPTGGDAESKDSKSSSLRSTDRPLRRHRPSSDGFGQERPVINVTLERLTHKPRSDRNDTGQHKPESSIKDKKSSIKRERTRSPASRSESGRRSDHEGTRKHKKKGRVEEHISQKKKYDSDSSTKKLKEEPAGTNRRKLHPDDAVGRKDSANRPRRFSREEGASERPYHDRRDEERLRRDKSRDVPEKHREMERSDRDKRESDKRERIKAREEEERRRVREEDDKRKAQVDLEARERKRQIYLTKEQQAIQNKAREESKKAKEGEVINRELELRKQRTEAERIEREKREKREEEERLAREKEAKEREVRERIAREAREREIREAKEKEEREAREREEREAEERRQAEIRRKEEEKRLEEEKKREEERKRREEEARKLEEARIQEEKRLEEERQRKLAEEQRLREEAERLRLEQQRLEEERRREEERKRQEAQREKEARDRKIAEELQRQLAEERRRNEEAAERRRLEEEARQREIARREALPYALRHAEESPAVLEKSKFLPLYCATFPAGSPCPSSAASTPVKPTGNGVAQVNGVGIMRPFKWILNVQAALVLGVTDLSLAGCKFGFRSSCPLRYDWTDQI